MKLAAQRNRFSPGAISIIKSRIKGIQEGFLVGVLMALTACAPLAVVHQTHPQLASNGEAPSRLKFAEEAIADGHKIQRSEPRRAIGLYLSSVEAAGAEWRRNPNDSRAVRDYNFALARVFSTIRDAHLNPWTNPLSVPSPGGGEFVLSPHPSADPRWKPQDFDLIPADELEVHGKFVVPRLTREGIGASLVAVHAPDAPTIRQPFLPHRVYLAVTAIAQFNGRNCKIEFIDPLATETVTVADRKRPAAADFTAPLALGLSRERPEKLALPAMLDPEKFAATEGLIQIQPYQPDKTPVLFVHGLQSTPVTWVPMVNALWADPFLRRNYQVWVFNYPSGYPIPYSAMLLRRELTRLDTTFPHHRPIVLVGHSMGGIISRLMISDSGGEKLWRYYFGKSPAETSLSPETKALLEESLIFKPRPDVARVVFISTPHRGSVIAQNPIGRFGSSLIRKSVKFMSVGPEILQASVVQQNDPGVLKLNRLPNSIDTLSPNDPFVKIANTLPLAKGIPCHSIIGDRGRGNTPKSSDGVVPYWSSHVDGAESEKIVPANHGANQNPEAIAEVMRILREQSKGEAQ